MKTFASSFLTIFLCVLMSFLEHTPLDGQQANITRIKPGKSFQWKTGRSDFLMPWDGVNRHFIVYLPQSYNHTKPTPVVFMFHGTTGTGHKMYRSSKWKEMADREGFIAVFPTSWKYPIIGKPKQTKWNATYLVDDVPPGTRLMDDVGFVRAIVRSLNTSLKVDEKRIFASGFSNGGGFITSRVLPELGDVFAAASAGGGIFREIPNMQNPPIPLYQMMGTNDHLIIAALQMPIPFDATQWLNHAVYSPFINRAITALELTPIYT